MNSTTHTEMNIDSVEWTPVSYVKKERPMTLYSIDNERSLRYAMTTKPVKYRNNILCLLQLLYADHPENFVIMGDLHQNSMTDPLHMSVSIEGTYGVKTLIHINGYFRNFFRIQTITMEIEKETTMLIADFTIVE